MFNTKRFALLATTAALAASAITAQAGQAFEPRPVVDGTGTTALMEEEGIAWEVVTRPDADAIIAVLIGVHAPRPFTKPFTDLKSDGNEIAVEGFGVGTNNNDPDGRP